ncbi:MAG: DUF4118 domain-containing protein, partial [Nitrospinae bacterium]|nr:DUF4118 domain-containing protein [Nitrospinota bacterium]
MQTQPLTRRIWLRYAVAVILVVIAAALRIWPLEGLGVRLAYLTFYPAVMITAIYGGLSVGLVATALSALT